MDTLCYVSRGSPRHCTAIHEKSSIAILMADSSMLNSAVCSEGRRRCITGYTQPVKYGRVFL